MEAEAAAGVGRLLAEAGVAVLCGGLGGVMAAACRGAAEAGGMTVGLLPGPDPNASNAHVRIAIATNLGHARNAVIAQAADALIAIGWGPGTLSEVALGLKLGKVVASLGSWDVPGVTVAATPEDAVRVALAAIP